MKKAKFFVRLIMEIVLILLGVAVTVYILNNFTNTDIRGGMKIFGIILMAIGGVMVVFPASLMIFFRLRGTPDSSKPPADSPKASVKEGFAAKFIMPGVGLLIAGAAALGLGSDLEKYFGFPTLVILAGVSACFMFLYTMILKSEKPVSGQGLEADEGEKAAGNMEQGTKDASREEPVAVIEAGAETQTGVQEQTIKRKEKRAKGAKKAIQTQEAPEQSQTADANPVTLTGTNQIDPNEAIANQTANSKEIAANQTIRATAAARATLSRTATTLFDGDSSLSLAAQAVLGKRLADYDKARLDLLQSTEYLLDPDCDFEAEEIKTLLDRFVPVQKALLSISKLCADAGPELQVWQRRQYRKISRAHKRITDAINDDDCTGDALIIELIVVLDDIRDTLDHQPRLFLQDSHEGHGPQDIARGMRNDGQSVSGAGGDKNMLNGEQLGKDTEKNKKPKHKK